MPRDGNAAWKSGSGTLRSSFYLQSPLLLLKAQASRCTASIERGGRSGSGRLRAAPRARRALGGGAAPALLGSGGRSCAAPAPRPAPTGKAEGAGGRESSRTAGKGAALCEEWAKLRGRGAGVQGLQWKVELI